MNLFGILCLRQINTTKVIINSCLYGLGGMDTSMPIITATMICKANSILSLLNISLMEYIIVNITQLDY